MNITKAEGCELVGRCCHPHTNHIPFRNKYLYAIEPWKAHDFITNQQCALTSIWQDLWYLCLTWSLLASVPCIQLDTLNIYWMNEWNYQTLFFSPILPIGVVPFQMLSAYGSTKAAITMFSSILRQELAKWGVKVVTIQPGGFKTSRYPSPRAL